MARSKRGSLVDRGANGGIIGDDAKVFLQHQRQVDVTGIDNHELNSLKIVDASAKITTQKGPVIVILRQYAYHGLGRSIHSAGQIEHYKNKVDDRSMKVGGRQCITTQDGYIIPLDIINGLPYMKMVPNTDKEWNDLPHVILTSSEEWDPTFIDNILTDQDDWYNTLKQYDDGLIQTPFDEYGNYRHRHVPANVQELPPVDPDAEVSPEIEVDFAETFRQAYDVASNLNSVYVCYNADTEDTTIEANPPLETKKKSIDYEKYRPYFLHVPVEKIRRTFQATTQNAVNVMSGHQILQTIQSPYPAHNVWRRNEPVASDTVYAEVPAIDTNGQKMAQLFIGRKSLVIDVYGMSTEKEFVNTLKDQIRKQGAMDKLITDSARVEISERVKDILRALCIDDWQSEPNYQHQNFAEHRWRHLKRNVQWYMNHRNVDPEAWLLCLQWVADVMNHTSERRLGWRPPLQLICGHTIDISILLCFLFWDVVYCARYKDRHYKNQVGSEKSSEIRGRFVGFAWDVGHALTFKVLTDDTKKVICRSRLRLAKVSENNLKLEVEAGADPERVYIRSKRDHEDDDFKLPTIDISTSPFTVGEDEPRQDHGDFAVQEQGETSPGVEQGETATTVDSTPVRELPKVETVNEDDDDDEEYESDDEDLPALHPREDYDSDSEDEDDDDDDDSSYSPSYSPMDDSPLHQNPEPEIDENDENDVGPHCRDETRTSLDQPYDFSRDSLRTENPTVPGLPPEEMIDRTFLMPPQEDGTRFRAKIIKRVQAHKKEMEKHPDLIKFKCLVNNDYEEVVAYNDVVDYIEQDQTWDGIWKFRRIIQHKKVHPKHPEYMGSSWNVQVEWETGEITWIPLWTTDGRGVVTTDPVTVAIYAREHNMLEVPGWRFPILKKLAKTQKRIIRAANQAKLHSFRTKPIYMYGFQVPRNHQQAMEFDLKNGNTRWRDAELIELAQIDEYNSFLDKGKGYDPGPGYKKIRVHLVYAVKHDGRHKARLVAGGHLTDTPIDSVYSSVVSLRGVRMLTFLAEHNDMETWCTDIGNAYLESYTQEKVYIKAGPEFGDREGHTLIIVKALYGLKSSGLRWHERFADVLRVMGFTPSRAEPDIWMRDMGDHYEYIAVYVDDLLIVSKDPQGIIDLLTKEHDFKLKGTGPISFHLGCDFFRDEDGVLCYAPKKYIEKILDNYRRLFGTNPKEASSPLTKGDHPELDTSPLLEYEDIQVYQSLVGALQWVIQIGRFDVTTAVMTLSRFRAAPRQGHMDRVKRIHGYLSKMRHAVIRIRTDEPDYSDIPVKVYDWAYTCYHGAEEEIPKDMPRPLGKPVKTSSYFDANLYHDLISGRSVTGILHLLNKTPIDWFSKLQSTVETATFGSEYVAGRTCTEQIIDL